MTTDNLKLARQWAADIDADRETLSQDTIDAAADLISSLPDEWVDAEALRRFVADWREGLTTWGRGGYVGEMLDGLEYMLPAPPAPRTMSEIEWDDDEHFFAEAETERGGNIVMLYPDEDRIICYFPNKTVGSIHVDGQFRSKLTPTGRKYRLEPEDDVASATGGELTTQDVVDECRAVRKERAAPEPASPRPEDVPAGEPWIVECGGHKWVGTREEGDRTDYEWSLARLDGVDCVPASDDEVTLIARLVPETTEEDMQ